METGPIYINCPLCPFIFATKSSLKNHLKSAHYQPQRYFFDKCDCKVAGKIELDSHQCQRLCDKCDKGSEKSDMGAKCESDATDQSDVAAPGDNEAVLSNIEVKCDGNMPDQNDIVTKCDSDINVQSDILTEGDTCDIGNYEDKTASMSLTKSNTDEPSLEKSVTTEQSDIAANCDSVTGDIEVHESMDVTVSVNESIVREPKLDESDSTQQNDVADLCHSDPAGHSVICDFENYEKMDVTMAVTKSDAPNPKHEKNDTADKSDVATSKCQSDALGHSVTGNEDKNVTMTAISEKVNLKGSKLRNHPNKNEGNQCIKMYRKTSKKVKTPKSCAFCKAKPSKSDLCQKCDPEFSPTIPQFRFWKNHGKSRKTISLCDKCDIFFANRYGLDQHLTQEHYREKVLACDQCHKTFSTSLGRKAHIQVHHRMSSSDHECKFCHIVTTSKDLCSRCKKILTPTIVLKKVSKSGTEVSKSNKKIETFDRNRNYAHRYDKSNLCKFCMEVVVTPGKDLCQKCHSIMTPSIRVFKLNL